MLILSKLREDNFTNSLNRCIDKGTRNFANCICNSIRHVIKDKYKDEIMKYVCYIMCISLNLS